MRNTLWGMVLAVGGLAGALPATAQVQIDNNGPTCVESDDPRCTFSATVTTDYDFDLNLKVYHNSVLKHDRTTFVVNDGPSYNYSEVVTISGWGLATGDSLLFRSKATLTEGPYQGSYATDNHTVTVSSPGTCFRERRREPGWRWV